jgi:electron transport complex protein RnfD
MAFTVSPPPHIKENVSVKALMWGRFIVLLPLCLASIYLFGFPALGVLISGVLGAVLTELAIQKTFHQKVTIGDGNAAYLGLLIALMVPPSVPIWMPFIGGSLRDRCCETCFWGAWFIYVPPCPCCLGIFEPFLG